MNSNKINELSAQTTAITCIAQVMQLKIEGGTLTELESNQFLQSIMILSQRQDSIKSNQLDLSFN